MQSSTNLTNQRMFTVIDGGMHEIEEAEVSIFPDDPFNKMPSKSEVPTAMLLTRKAFLRLAAACNPFTAV